MNQNILLIILFIVVFGFWTIIKNFGPAGKVKITPANAKKRLDTEKGIILLDVRNREEHIKRHIPNSTLIPVNVLANEANKRLPDKNAEIFVYCASGSRSAVAVNTLIKMGYTKIYNLGGIFRWPYETVNL